MRERILWPIMLGLAVIGLTLASEISARLISASIYEYDGRLGWVAKPDFVYRKNVKDISGREYGVLYDTDRHGFREWGDVGGSAKVFVVGDSYTGGLTASDAGTYFGIVKSDLGAEVFAAGASGYGTLQELMLVERFIDEIKPTIFVLQFCENDFDNNSFEIESNSIVRNQKDFRPYLVGNKVVYRDAWFYRFLVKHLVIASRIDSFIQNWQYRQYGGYSPKPVGVEEQRIQEMAFQRAVATTKLLLSKMHDVVRKYTDRMYAIDCHAAGEFSKEHQYWIEISKETGFIPLPTVALEVERHEKAGEVVRYMDGAHWNDNGNLIAGRELSRLLRGQIAHPSGLYMGHGSAPPYRLTCATSRGLGGCPVP